MSEALTLASACLAIVDCEHKTAPVDPSGDFFAVGTPAMSGNVIDYAAARRISRATYLDWTRRLTPQVGDLLLAREAPVGPVVQIPDSANVAPGQRTVLLRPDPTILDPRFFYYLMTSPQEQAKLLIKAEGSTVAHLNVADVRSYELPVLPSLAEQRAIASTLGAIDDKVECALQASAVIDALLAAMFQRTLAAEAVEFVQLGELAAITKGVSYKSADLAESRTSLVTLKSFDRGGGYKTAGLKPYVGPYKPSQVIQPGEVVVAQTDLTQGAEVVGRAVRVPRDDSADTLVASLDLVVVRPNAALTNEYLLGVLSDEAFRQHCRNRTNGTTVLHLASDALPTYEAPVVSAEAQEGYSAVARPLIARRDALEQEITALHRTRDSLLPGLLSGRIRVGEAREAVA